MRDEDLQLWQRRDLLKAGSALALLCGLPAIGGAPLWAPTPDDDPPNFDWQRVLVLVELKGGNDGLNTVVPYGDQRYYEQRKLLSVAQDQVLRMSRKLGLHPQLEPLMASIKAGDCAIIQGCGYQKPNRSHFRGIDIWNAGSEPDELAHDGWLARILADVAATAPDDLTAHGVVWGHSDTVGHAGLGPLYGHELRNLVMDRTQDFIERAERIAPLAAEATNPAHAHVLRIRKDVLLTAERLRRFQDQVPQLRGRFPSHRFGQHCQRTAELIAAGAKIPVYKLTLDGFDTHAKQHGRHEELLGQFAGGIAALREALIGADCWDRTLVMTYSEFGRRVADNDSGGTDHGAAAPHFMLGGKVRGQLYGEHPSLSHLVGGDLRATTDYRQLYATVAREWWGYQRDFLSRRNIRPLRVLEA